MHLVRVSYKRLYKEFTYLLIVSFHLQRRMLPQMALHHISTSPFVLRLVVYYKKRSLFLERHSQCFQVALRGKNH